MFGLSKKSTRNDRENESRRRSSQARSVQPHTSQHYIPKVDARTRALRALVLAWCLRLSPSIKIRRSLFNGLCVSQVSVVQKAALPLLISDSVCSIVHLFSHLPGLHLSTSTCDATLYCYVSYVVSDGSGSVVLQRATLTGGWTCAHQSPR